MLSPSGGRLRRLVAGTAPLLLVVLLLSSCSDDKGGGGGGSSGGGGDSVGGGDSAGGSVGGSDSGGDSGGDSGEASEPDLTSDAFLTPSKNIACLLRRQALRCDIFSGLNPEPIKFPCPVDWTGAYIDSLVDAGPVCAGDTVLDPEAAVLEYGQTWSRGDLTCESASSGLRCVDTVGNGFTLARGGWEILGKSAAAKATFRELRTMIRAKARDFGQGEVIRVSAPHLVGGRSCGGLQEAAVTVEFAVEPSPGTYFVCYVSGRWLIESGPNFGE